MQVFIPFPDIQKTARALDYRRLGKQRVEAWQLLEAMRHKAENDLYNANGKKRGWLTHKCTIMWEPYAPYLAFYALLICAEWKRRNYQENMTPRFERFLENCSEIVPPCWWGREDIHASHRAVLMQKDPVAYQSFAAITPPDVSEYVWVTYDTP